MDAPKLWHGSGANSSLSTIDSAICKPTPTTNNFAHASDTNDDEEYKKYEEFLQTDIIPPTHLHIDDPPSPVSKLERDDAGESLPASSSWIKDTVLSRSTSFKSKRLDDLEGAHESKDFQQSNQGNAHIDVGNNRDGEYSHSRHKSTDTLHQDSRHRASESFSFNDTQSSSIFSQIGDISETQAVHSNSQTYRSVDSQQSGQNRILSLNLNPKQSIPHPDLSALKINEKDATGSELRRARPSSEIFQDNIRNDSQPYDSEKGHNNNRVDTNASSGRDVNTNSDFNSNMHSRDLHHDSYNRAADGANGRDNENFTFDLSGDISHNISGHYSDNFDEVTASFAAPRRINNESSPTAQRNRPISLVLSPEASFQLSRQLSRHLQNQSPDGSPSKNVDRLVMPDKKYPSILHQDSAFTSRTEYEDREDGVRYRESLIRSLEAENLELKLKIQQVKAMSLNDDTTKVKAQLLKLDRRVIELEAALRSKNRTIEMLNAEHERQGELVQDNEKEKLLYDQIMALQEDLTELEKQAREERHVKKSVLSKAHLEMPDLISENADTNELVAAVRKLRNELDVNTSTNALLLEQANQIRDLLEQHGRVGNPLLSLQQLLSEFDEAKAEATRLQDAYHTEKMRITKQMEASKMAVQNMQNKLEEQNEKLQSQKRNYELLEKDYHDARKVNYATVRQFFEIIVTNSDTKRKKEIEGKLQRIVDYCKANSVTKFPYLVDYMIKVSEQIAKSSSFCNEFQEINNQLFAKDQEIRSLEHILSVRFEKTGADKLLREQVKELSQALKTEKERRQAERIALERTVKEYQNK